MLGGLSLTLAIALSVGIARAQPVAPCPTIPATLTIYANNQTDAAVEISVDGALVDPATTCQLDATSTDMHDTYGPSTLTCPVGGGRCGQITGLRPGAWIHRIEAHVPGSDPQRQAQQSVLLGGPAGDASNVLPWTLYARTFVVGDATSVALRTAIDRATGYTACESDRQALVTFSWDTFPGANDPERIDLFGDQSCDGGTRVPCRRTAVPDRCPCDPASEGDPCMLGGEVDDAVVGLCLPGDRIVVDGLDRDGRMGGAILSVGACDEKLLRLYGGDTTVRGLKLEGSQTQNPFPESPEPCTSDLQGRRQVDAVVMLGNRARRNRLEQSIVVGPTCGDAVSIQDGAGAAAGDEPGTDVVADTTISGAADRGIKVDFGAVAAVERSCVYGNLKGGIQSTLGGHLDVRENVVQRNRGGESQNGITVIDSCSTAGCAVCSDDDPQCTAHRRSTLTTTGNIVRFSGGRGLSVRDDATATFYNDYVAGNAFKGSVVETTDLVPLAAGVEQAPAATFRGVALVCNYEDGAPGVGAETRRDDNPIPHASPQANYGDDDEPGRNAFTSNTNPSAAPSTDQGGNFLLTNLQPPYPTAVGNQWAHCGTADTCDLTSVLASDIVPADAAVPLVATGEVALDGPRAGTPELYRVTPARPRKGDVVRVYGNHFNAIEGNPTRDACSTDVVACTDGACPSGPCVDGHCPCAITDQAVRDRNDLTNANHVRLLAGGTIVAEFAPDAVTPTMLAFHMPVDCYQAMALQVDKRGAGAAIALCDANGCRDAPAGTPCEDPYPFTVNDQCDGSGLCQGELSTTSTLIEPTTTSTTTASPTTTGIGSTTTSSTALPSTSTTTSSPPTTAIASTTTSSTAPSTTAAVSSTTTSTIVAPPPCDVTRPSTCDLEQCHRRKLHRAIVRLANRIQRRLDAGKPPKARWSNRLAKLLARCGVPTAPR